MRNDDTPTGILLRFGNGGWVQVEATNVPGTLALRFAPNESGRLKVRELYLDAGADLEGAHLRSLPLAMLEGVVNEERHQVLQRLEVPSAAAGIATLAKHLGTTFGKQARHWVAAAYWAQFAGASGSRPPAEGKFELTTGTVVYPSKDDRPRVTRPGTREGFTDAFYADVATAYSWLTRRGFAPGPVIAEDAGAPVGTVHRWVREARRRGHLPPAAKGQRG